MADGEIVGHSNLPEVEAVMARTVAQIDRDLDVERAIWIMERRNGDHCREAEKSRAILDQLLDERLVAKMVQITR